MDFDDIVKIVDQVKVLEARLAVAEAERAASNAQLASVLHDIHRVEAERDAALAEVERLQADIMNVHLKRAMLVVQRDAAQAGEARAVEALQRCHEGAARQLAEPRDHDNDQYALTAIATDCEVVLAAQRSALAWLAQQRREAAAGALEKFADEAGGIEELRACNISDLRSRLRARAAALRAGEVGND